MTPANTMNTDFRLYTRAYGIGREEVCEYLTMR